MYILHYSFYLTFWHTSSFLSILCNIEEFKILTPKKVHPTLFLCKLSWKSAVVHCAYSIYSNLSNYYQSGGGEEWCPAVKVICIENVD